MTFTSTSPVCAKCGHTAGYHGMTFCTMTAGASGKRRACDCDGWSLTVVPAPLSVRHVQYDTELGNDGVLDDLAVDHVAIAHLEQLDNKSAYLALYSHDPESQRVMVDIRCHRNRLFLTLTEQP